MNPWKTLKSEYLHRDKWLTVRADTCETEQGVSVDPYYVLEYSDWVNIVAIDCFARVLIIKQYRHGIGKVVYELPCGVIEKGEEVEVAARRELQEETGCTAEVFEPLASLNPNSATHSNEVHCFLARNAAITTSPTPDHTEEITCEFLSVSKIMEMIDDGSFCQAQHVASLMIGLRRAGLLSEYH